MRRRRLLRSSLFSPAFGGTSKWGNHPHARMSILSVLLSAATVAGFCAAGLWKWAGLPMWEDAVVYALGGLMGMTFLSGSLDVRRDRRLGLLPQRRRWFRLPTRRPSV